MTLLVRAAFALAATGVVVWFLRSGLPLGGLAILVLGVLLRQRAESFTGRRAEPNR